MDLAGIDEHRLPRRPVAPSRAPAERPVLGAAARRRTSAASALGLVRMVRPWNEWLIVWGYDINQPPPDVDEEMATRIVHDLVGDDTIAVTIRSTSLWGNNKMYADALPSRAGCSAWATPCTGTRRRTGSAPTPRSRTPTTWPGSSRYVLRGTAAPALLDSYDAERAPVGRQIVLRANKSIEEFGPIFEALGAARHRRPGRQMRANIERAPGRHPGGRAAAARSCARRIELKDYEFNAHGVELGQRYASGAVVADGTPEPAYTRDPELYHHPTTWPGARLPHVWLGRDGRRVSTHDLAGKGRFCLLTGIAGEAWADAADEGRQPSSASRSRAYVIGPGREYIDLYDDWARAREVGEDGCVLVRPDMHVAWRAAEAVDDPAAELRRVLTAVLAR